MNLALQGVLILHTYKYKTQMIFTSYQHLQPEVLECLKLEEIMCTNLVYVLR